MSARTGSLYWLGVITSRRIGDPGDKLLLLAMADHVDQDDATFAGIALLADEAEMSERTARTRPRGLPDDAPTGSDRGPPARPPPRSSTGESCRYGTGCTGNPSGT